MVLLNLLVAAWTSPNIFARLILDKLVYRAKSFDRAVKTTPGDIHSQERKE
jgi:hypothetical protein